MKKMVSLLLCVLMVSTGAVFAENAKNADDEEPIAAMTDNTDENPEETAEEVTDETAEETAEKTEEEKKNVLIYAVESELQYMNGEVKNIWARPFVYDETTYVPLRSTVESLGGIVGYDGETNTISADYGEYHYSVAADDASIRNFDGTAFVPVRVMCETLGFKVNWNEALITVADEDVILSEDEIAHYKDILHFEGYKDAYLTPRSVVNPRIMYTYDFMNGDLALLARIYPDLFDVYSIGQSTEGREIMAFTFGKGSKKVILCGSMHAREYIATNFLMYMVDSYALSYVNNEIRDGYNVRELLDSVSFIIVPMVNPDGINLVQNGYDSTQNPENVKNMPANQYGARGWKATVNGVDLNNNFDCLWRPKGTAPSFGGYAGPYAASEPETRAMQKLIDETDFEILASFHAQGQVLYWMDPNCNQELVGKFSPYIDRICREIGYEKMPSDGEKGYSGYMTDYVRYFKQKMAMTLELCPYIGDYPYPESNFDAIAYPIRNIGFILAEIAKTL